MPLSGLVVHPDAHHLHDAPALRFPARRFCVCVAAVAQARRKMMDTEYAVCLLTFVAIHAAGIEVRGPLSNYLGPYLIPT